ncbi:ABC-type transport system involved in multi-copper enzyme maturation permease subunit [Allocatelliglobosispora scoriae]|uniref:ABC-type transport system involved in multi-copper enzyme maturation permease subunit n=1 Tax=Allocatelliglobosispora scoriae TaxID=643052 RepID=A0A841C1I0_9ACTN|nr:ABC transporter permease subunit [Allocatelliglobosispora scoriae]MBB5872830.1 ABC-type transport system involved in multi-copper enzyme maturation permease subunit [Allocatelliglobosispora scoriae]
MNLIRSEFLKLRTTSAWWLFTIGVAVLWALAFAANTFGTYVTLHPEKFAGPEGPQGDQVEAVANVDFTSIASNLYTSGQFFGLLFAMLLGILLITSEFQHQTLTTTFLTTPRRSSVVAAKLAVSAVGGVFFWFITTLLSVPGGAIFLSSEGQSAHLGDTEVLKAVGLNLLAFCLWGIFGLGFGVLIRSQIGATVTAAVLYVIGTFAVSIIFELLAAWQGDWIRKFDVIVPSIASAVMVSGTQLPDHPPQWVGAAILIGYAVVAGTIGTLILRRRDIS